MGMSTPEELLRLWATEHISADMAIGQVLQHLVKMQVTVEQLNRNVSSLRLQVENSSLQSGNGLTQRNPAKSVKKN